MADDTEKAILISFDYGGAIDPALKVQAGLRECVLHACSSQPSDALYAPAGEGKCLHKQHKTIPNLLEGLRGEVQRQ